MPILEGLLELRVAPLAADHILDVVREEVGKGFPRLRPMHRIADSHNLVVPDLHGDNRPAETLLRLADVFLSRSRVGNLAEFSWRHAGASVEPPVTPLELHPAAARALLV